MNDHKIALVPEPSRSRLNERQRLDYEDHRRQLIDWLLTFGKKPDHGEGYAYETIRNDSYRLDQFYRWIWDEFDGYTTEITQSHADAYIRHLASREESNYSRSNTQSAIKRLFKWKHYERGGNLWNPEITFSEPSSTSQPRDFLTLDERRKVREAALKYGSIPSYNDLSPEDRDRWKAYLAQRLGKPKRKVKPDDWNKANSWKFPSLVWTSLDAGLRPIEVERATNHVGRRR